jgi:hypothetical protein
MVARHEPPNAPSGTAVTEQRARATATNAAAASGSAPRPPPVGPTAATPWPGRAPAGVATGRCFTQQQRRIRASSHPTLRRVQLWPIKELAPRRLTPQLPRSTRAPAPRRSRRQLGRPRAGALSRRRNVCAAAHVEAAPVSVGHPVRAAPRASMPRRRSRRRSPGQAAKFAPPECPAAASHARQSCDLAISRHRAPRLRLQLWLPSQCRRQLRHRRRAASDAKAAPVWADRPGRADEGRSRCCHDGSADSRVCWVSAPVRRHSPAKPAIPGQRRDVPPLQIEAPTPPMAPHTCPT